MQIEESYISYLRREIVRQYKSHPTGCGGSFGELLCWEIHENNMTFSRLAEKWGISLPTLGDLIKDHCDRLQELPKIKFVDNQMELDLVEIS
jgi:hypothetical protein